jgi:hypothetical protein
MNFHTAKRHKRSIGMRTNHAHLGYAIGDMNMFDSFGRGWNIAKASWSVLKRHPKLLVLPAISAVALLALVGLFAAMAGMSGLHLPKRFPNGIDHGTVTAYAAFFVLYFTGIFVAVFFNAALVFCALQAFAGHEPSLRQGLATATGRLPQILMWALVASTVGLLLQALADLLKDKFGIFGGLLGFVGQAAWAVATYFTVPVLVVEGTGPIEAIKRSSALLREKWGEAASGSGGLGLVSSILILPAALLIVLLAVQGLPVLPLFVIVAFYILAVSLVFTTLGTLFRTGVYVYAATGNAPAPYGEDLVRGAFRGKR